MREILGIAALAVMAAACGEESRSYVPNVQEDTPTMSTSDVSTFISDSGYTRYHITAPEWQMFEEYSDPYWRFPDGIHLEEYDLQMRPDANIRSDSATYYSRRRLWRLDGNVVMINTDGDSFLTQQLFWDQQKREVYSDSFIHIVRTDRVIEGYGFTSNENMTAYQVRRPTGIIPVDKRPDGAVTENSDTAATDSILPPPAAPSRRAPARASQRSAPRFPASISDPTTLPPTHP